ncbi:MAG: VWA domain-containing protein [Treponema sp.]|jgi:Ca-activated chloride channel family protein|nr:VWA domain-containing protein [Treponema sp.]
MEEIMFPNKLKGVLVGAILSLALCCTMFAEGFAESVSPRAKSRYLVNNGIILAPEDIYTDSYLASYNYGYPEPETDIGVNIYNKLDRTIPLGRDHLGPEGIIQIGIQGKTWGFAELPSLNLVFVVDTSLSMNDDNKLFWFKTSMGNFIKKIRSIDSLSLVSFSNSAQVVFEPALMDSTLKRRAFLDAVDKLYPQGLTNIEAGISLGYEQIVPYYRENSINQVLLFSDGDEFSARLAQPNARTGDIRISLMWNNRNDLDLHVITPTGEEINFNNPRDSNGGVLEADRNLYGETLKAVENIFWPDGAAPRGSYRVYIQNYLNHETDSYLTPFQIEIKNGKEYLYFEGAVHGSGRSSITEICTFEYTGNDTLDRLQQLVEIRKQQGISLSTIGLGRNFDAELLRTLAEYGQGASRSLRSRGDVDGLLNTDREFGRIAVPAAENLDVELEFTPGIEIVEVLGYQHRIENNRVICRINSLHQGDYKTFFVRYRIPPQNRGLQVAALHVKSPQGSSTPEVGLYTDGNTTPGLPGSFERVVVLTDPVNDFAAGMLRRSGAVLDFANAVREIATHYYNSENDLTRLESALQISRETGRELETVKRSVRNDEAFNPELSVIAKYIEILNDRIAENRRSFVNETHSRMISDREGSFSRMTR